MSTITPIETFHQKSRQLISNFIKGKEPAFMEKHSGVLDEYFRQSFEKSMIGPRMGIVRNPYAMIALGGYGREEQCICSDVDLLFLFKKRVPDETEGLIKEIVYPLWDIGLDVGYATRSVKECQKLAMQDIEVLTSLLDARFICGHSLLYSELMEQLREKYILKRSKKIIAQLLEINRSRHAHFGDSTHLLEPHLKEGQGGTRDYHTMLWIARIESNVRQPKELEFYGYFSHGAFQALEKTLSFIWKVRNHLHYVSGRKCDQLHLEYQDELAGIMNFRQDNGQQPVEKFLGELHAQMESLKQQYYMFVFKQGYEKELKRKKEAVIQTDVPGLEVQRDMLYFKSSEDVLKSPDLLIEIFEESLHLKIPLSGEAKQLAKELKYLIDDEFRTSPSIVRSFERIMAGPTRKFDVLNEMLSTGILAQFIPQFKGITNRIQYDEYHLYPVDKHSLLTVRAVKEFRRPENSSQDPLCHSLYKDLSNKNLLLWAALLHDIGKGQEGKGHSKSGAAIARVVLKTFGLKEKDIDTVAFLIEEHLLLPETATRRDINDEETAIFCARKIKRIGRLKMLYLLSVADSISTGPKARNDWTAALLRSLFLKVLSIMENGELATNKAIKNLEKKKEGILSSATSPESKDELDALFNVMSPRYLLYASQHEILDHIKLFQGLGNKSFMWSISKNSESNTRTVTICANDRPGLFSQIAGTFTLNGLNILDSQIFTWRNNIALDIFKVEAPLDRIFEDERWAKVEKNLQDAISGEIDLAAALKKKMFHYKSKPHLFKRPNQVLIDNNSSSFFTIIEVYTYDFPGLLFGVTDALFRCGLDIWVAKIATKIDQVVDVFYVRDFDGQKVDAPHQVDTIKKEIVEVLPGSTPT